MSVDLLGSLLAGARKADIQDGITDNCVILAVSNTARKNKDKEVIKRNTYIKFGRIGDKGTVTAEKEISYFDLQHDSDYAYDNLFEQLFQMTTIAEALTSPEEVDDIFNAVFEEEEIESVEDLQDTAKNKAGVKSLMKALGDSFVELLEDKVGTKSQKVRLKLTFDTKGRFIQQPKYGQFVESMETPADETKLKLSSRELEYKQKSQQASVAQTTAPTL